MKVTTNRRLALGAVLLAGLTLTGCGDADGTRTDLSGTVSFNGQPVPKGRIYFNPVAAANAEGLQGYAEITSGRYSTAVDGKGPSPGAVEVKVEGLGDPTPEYPGGRPLFLNYVEKEKLDVPAKGSTTHDVQVPAAARAQLPAKAAPAP